jgi:hypothetical protein
VTLLRSRGTSIAVGVLALLAALWAGLVRLGWPWPPLLSTLPAAHGPLMIAGVLGTLTALERAVALGLRWTYIAPAVTAVGALALLLGLPGPVGPLLITLGSLGMVAVFATIVRRQPALYTATMALGAVCWLVGNSLWLAGRPLPGVVAWWAGFLVLTIAGERLELGRVLRPAPSAQTAFLAITALYLLGLVASVVAFEPGTRLAGVAMLLLALWLLRYDLARRTVRQAGLTRFIAASLLSGYTWLGISGLLWLAFAGASVGPYYDAMLHTVFLGFVFAMVFGHAPIILPALSGRGFAFHPALYTHLALLHVSLALRVGGDLLGAPSLRLWGGLLNAITVLLFLANTVCALRSARALQPAEATH